MPARSMKICRMVGCGGRTRERHGFCEACAAAGKGAAQYDRFRGSASSRGYGSRWGKLRARVLAEEVFCRICSGSPLPGAVQPGLETNNLRSGGDGSAGGPNEPLPEGAVAGGAGRTGGRSTGERKPLVPATEVDHISPRRVEAAAGRDPDRRENLQGLCKSCHSRKTATEDGGFGR